MANTNPQDNNRDSNNRDTQQNQSSGRGFASMDKDRQREIAAEGGRAS
ncbi:KGG domain-containing protein, partial [Diaphorobacter sp.]